MGRIYNWFSDFKVRSKLSLLTGIFIVFLILMAFATNFLFKASKTLTILINEERIFIESFDAGITEFYKYQISGNPKNLDKAYAYLGYTNNLSFAFAHSDSLMQTMSEQEWLDHFHAIFKQESNADYKITTLITKQLKLILKYQAKRFYAIQKIAHESNLIGVNIVSLIKSYEIERSEEKLQAIQAGFDQLHKITEEFGTHIYLLVNYVTKAMVLLLIFLVIVLGLITTLIASRISKSISDPINKLSDNFKKIAVGSLNSTVEIDTKNEIGELSNAFLKIQVGFQDIVSYSKKIATGDYSTKLEPKSEQDELAMALNTMALKLKNIKESSEYESWIQKGINELDNRMNGNASVRVLSKEIITYLSQYLDFEIGAVYVFDEMLEHLELTGSIGLVEEKLKKTILPGEGLIGKAALHKTLQIIDTKDKYHKVFSATGEMFPEKSYFLPLNYDKRIQAVLEFAPLTAFSEQKLEFLRIASDRISINLNASVARFRTKELLDESLKQAEILQKREEELSKNLEENKRIQEKLVQEKALLDSMLKTIPDYIHFKDMDGKFLRVSESVVKLFEVDSAEKIIGKSDFDFHPPKEAQRYFDEEMQIIEKAEGFIDEIREGVDKNNNPVWSSITKLPIYDETGKCLGTFGISKNVTDIKKLEVEVSTQNDRLVSNQNELENSINKLQKTQSELEREKILMDSLLQNLPDAIYFKDIESKFVKVSNYLLNKFNAKSPEEIYGKTDFDFQNPEHARKAFEDEQTIIKTKKPIVGYIEKESSKDGVDVYVLSTKMPYFNEKGEVIGTFGISRDITKIKELEVEIKKQNKKLQQKQDELTVAYNDLNLQQEELQTANEELKSQEEELRVANEELEEQTKILKESERSMQVQQEELRVTNEELEFKTNQLELQKKAISQKNDILRKAQLNLEQKANELQLASQYKSEFLANMSHELRTPLNSMLILSKLLGNNKEGNLNASQVKSANIIYKSGNDLLELINEILDLSKIEAGKMTFNFNDFATDEITTAIDHGFKPVAENKNLKLTLNQSKDFPKILYSDKQRLLQIIKNILSNAFKFTTSGGIEINLQIPDADFKFTNPELNAKNSCLISVTDTGVGIPKDKLNAIFEAFQQADGSISRNFGGTGLGLSISKELIRILGGEIQVESTENVGSVFYLIIPTDKSLVGEGHAKEETTVTVKGEEKIAEPLVKKQNASKIKDRKKASKPKEIPLFIPDDRHNEKMQNLVLIIHPEKEKAIEFLAQCREHNFSAVVAKSIDDGISLAEKYTPKAIIISAALNAAAEYNKLQTNSSTSQLPIHHVSRIEDDTLDSFEDILTPLSKGIEKLTNNLENKINTEYNQVLIVEDDLAIQQALHLLFRNKNIIIHDAVTGQQAFDMISAKTFDCIILDLGLPDFSGLELLKKLKKNNIPAPNVIIHTARDLSQAEIREINKYSESIVIKGVKSDERLLEEVSLFLHQISSSLPKEPPVASNKYQSNSSYKGKKVLLVDDDIRNVFALAQILEEKEIEVLEAENGQVAIDILKSNSNIDLVLMDIMMPVMDGYNAMKIIRKTHEIQNVPIITLTAKAMKEDYQKAIDCGANDYISKPLDVDKLFELLKIWLSK